MAANGRLRSSVPATPNRTAADSRLQLLCAVVLMMLKLLLAAWCADGAKLILQAINGSEFIGSVDLRMGKLTVGIDTRLESSARAATAP